jgi:hypothetical protein
MSDLLRLPTEQDRVNAFLEHMASPTSSWHTVQKLPHCRVDVMALEPHGYTIQWASLNCHTFSTITFFSKYTFGVKVAVFFFGAVGIRIDYSTQLVSYDVVECIVLRWDGDSDPHTCGYTARPDNLMYDSGYYSSSCARKVQVAGMIPYR